MPWSAVPSHLGLLSLDRANSTLRLYASTPSLLFTLPKTRLLQTKEQVRRRRVLFFFLSLAITSWELPTEKGLLLFVLLLLLSEKGTKRSSVLESLSSRREVENEKKPDLLVEKH